jgi:hypothetical protein
MMKYYRPKSEEEEVGEEYSRHLETIGESHETICAKHALDEEEGEFESALELEQFGLREFIAMKKALAETQKGDDTIVASKDEGSKKGKKLAVKTAVWAKAGVRGRKVQGHLYTQLAVAFMNRSNHYHHAELFEAKTQETWMPAYQGVSCGVEWCG